MPQDLRGDIKPAAVERFSLAALNMMDISRSMITQALQQGFRVEKKADASFLTSVDLDVERQLRRMITEQFPDHGILGEELPPHLPAAAYRQFPRRLLRAIPGAGVRRAHRAHQPIHPSGCHPTALRRP